MIEPLPEKISTNILARFTMGELEPEDDKLLLPCFCEIPPITRFLRSNKLVLLGGKGTGKTALFTLLRRGYKEFPNPKRHHQLLIPVSTDIEYTRLRTAVSEVLRTEAEDLDIQFRYFWEIYLLYRLLYVMRSEGLINHGDHHERAEKFLDVFSPEVKDPSLIDFLKSIRLKFGVKVDASNPAFPMPDFYVEPSESGGNESETAELNLSLNEVKELANSILSKNKTYTYITIDNVDDFVAREEYEIQKMLIQGLLQCARGFNAYPHIKIKLFLRTELYKSINFSQVGGYEKISTEQLRWSTADIWHFIGERILWNLKTHLEIEQDFFYVGEQRRIELESWQGKPNWWESIVVKMGFKPKKSGDHRDSYDVSSIEHAYRAAMTTILPRTIKHFEQSGAVNDVELFDFLDTHFRLGNDELAPRLFIWYFQKVFELCEEYYERNPQSNLKKDENGEYPLIRRKEMLAAYGWLQTEVQSMFLGAITHKAWREWLEIFFKKKGARTTFSYKSIIKIVGVDADQNLKEFLAFLNYVGVLDCRDKALPLDRRQYDLPILLRKKWATEEMTAR